MPDIRFDLPQDGLARPRKNSPVSMSGKRRGSGENQAESGNKDPLAPMLSKISERTEPRSEPLTPTSPGVVAVAPDARRCVFVTGGNVSPLDALVLNALIVPVVKVISKSSEQIPDAVTAGGRHGNADAALAPLRRARSCDSLLEERGGRGGGGGGWRTIPGLRGSFERILTCERRKDAADGSGGAPCPAAPTPMLVGVKPRSLRWQPSVEHIHPHRVVPKKRSTEWPPGGAEANDVRATGAKRGYLSKLLDRGRSPTTSADVPVV
ncbi:PREDICTED: uncharacterized protein LOC106813149 [Priapulus caudatus]|uniref:Uncharacterized protein LOC106813149 n=1 Tax=Priapulus caudatus TaxID=37621 RepID=A0ABM1EKH8_PRICU|nr:PREDICTED: uncharacterized protein LOC106813149 [Priapulus caudatus]XP_014672699.1 PREDICTED: uncharacterized protein LOC106813149 [Priapulus caudatus]